MHTIIFGVLLFAACGYSFWRGGGDSRKVALICVAGSLLSVSVLPPIVQRYANVEGGVVAVDIATLLGFTAVALSSTRFWPIWIASLQLTTLFVHLSKRLDGTLVPLAYAAAGRFWGYPILLLLVLGTWRGRRRMLAEGRDSP